MTDEEYEDFRHQAVHALIELNDALGREFSIGQWPRWDYELTQGTLTFSEDGIAKVVADIEVVGSTSTVSNTWMWSWANENLPAKVVTRMRAVREFGIVECIGDLTTELLDDQDELGWAHTAVAARVLKAKGGYRCPSEHGFLYLVFIDIRHASKPNFERASPDSKHRVPISCDNHGESWSTYLCRHLGEQPAQEWFSDEPSSENQWPDAWCEACDKIYQEQGEWNEANEGRVPIQLFCHRCYENARSQGFL